MPQEPCAPARDDILHHGLQGPGNLSNYTPGETMIIACSGHFRVTALSWKGGFLWERCHLARRPIWTATLTQRGKMSLLATLDRVLDGFSVSSFFLQKAGELLEDNSKC